MGIADVIFAYTVQPLGGALHWLREAQVTQDPSALINWLGFISLHQSLLLGFLAMWLVKRHRPRYESKINATYYKVR